MKSDEKSFLFHFKSSSCSEGSSVSVPTFFGPVGKPLDEKTKFNFKIYDVRNWETNNCKHMLYNILRSKGNYTMKFGQLIESNINIFLEK